MRPAAASNPIIERVAVAAYQLPTATPEGDGTLAWDATVLVVCDVDGGGERGIGYTYADAAAARLIETKLADAVTGLSALAPQHAAGRLRRAIRNDGVPGMGAMAISAVDVALWDLKAKIFGVSLVDLLGAERDAIVPYGSGGFTTCSIEELQRQLRGWAEEGIGRVKMKVGAVPADDGARVRAAREAIGPDVELFVDANGAYRRKEALAFAEEFAKSGVVWFEEPVSSDDLEGLRLLRDRAPAGMSIAAGEYGWGSIYFRRMLAAGAVDILQADATRCGGVSGFMEADVLCRAFTVPLSAHTAPTLHASLCCAAASAIHVEHFFDHARIEKIFFDGAIEPRGGLLRPDRTRPGLGFELRRHDIEKFRIA